MSLQSIKKPIELYSQTKKPLTLGFKSCRGDGEEAIRHDTNLLKDRCHL